MPKQSPVKTRKVSKKQVIWQLCKKNRNSGEAYINTQWYGDACKAKIEESLLIRKKKKIVVVENNCVVVKSLKNKGKYFSMAFIT